MRHLLSVVLAFTLLGAGAPPAVGAQAQPAARADAPAAVHIERTHAKRTYRANIEALTGADPLTCSGYPETRRFLEVQSWWADPGQAEPSHLHAGTCWPLAANMSGSSTFDVRVMLHNNPGTLFALSFDLYSGYEQYVNVPDVTCGLGLNCTYWYSVTVDWASVPAGWRELRLKPRVMFPTDTTPGATQITSAGWPVQVRSGTSGTRSSCQTNKTTCFTESRGWYELRGYQNVQVNNVLLLTTGNVWSGTKTVAIKLNCSCSGDDAPTTKAWAVVDPDFHNGNTGIPVMTPVFGSFNGSISINTVALGLVNGPHKLVLLAESAQPAHTTPGTLTGVGVYPFTVAN